MALSPDRYKRPSPQQRQGEGLSTGGFLLATLLTVAFGVGVVVAGYFWMGRSLPPEASSAVASATGRADPTEPIAPLDDGTWTDSDIRSCKDKATAAAEVAKKRRLAAVGDDRVGLGGPDSGVVERSTYLLCGATTKPLHLCQNYWRKWFVDALRKHAAEFRQVSTQAYWTKYDVAERARKSKNQAEWQTFSDDLEQTTREVAQMHDDIVAGFRRLIEDGIILPDHFAKIFGLGIPTDIRKMIGDAKPLRNSCG